MKMADHIAKMSGTWKWGNYAIAGAAVTIGATSLLDGVNTQHERASQYKQMRIQKKNLEEKIERSNGYNYMGMSEPGRNPGLVQQMFDSRSGHSNSWGGKKY